MAPPPGAALSSPSAAFGASLRLALAKSKMKGGVGEAGEAPRWVGDSRWRLVQEGRFLAGVLAGDSSEVVAELGAALSDPAGSVGTAPARSAAAKGKAWMHKVALAAVLGQIFPKRVAHGACRRLNSAPRRNTPGTRLCRREPCPKAAGDPNIGAVLPELVVGEQVASQPREGLGCTPGAASIWGRAASAWGAGEAPALAVRVQRLSSLQGP